MSAFVVDKRHINAMIEAGLINQYGEGLNYHHNGEWYKLTLENASETGQMLLDENIASVSYRYDDSHLTDLPGRVDAEYVIPFSYKRIFAPTGVETIKNIQCYEYQACEHPEWKISKAKAFCAALMHAQYDRLPGYEAAPWGWEDKAVKVARFG